MLNFTYYTPTKVLFGKNAEAKTGELIKEQKAKRVLIHYGSSSAKASGLLARIQGSLEEAGLEYVLLGGVVPNPRLSKVYEGIELCKKEDVDFILAVGGGSVIDSAKAISYGVANEFDVWELFGGRAKAAAFLPVGAVLTIAAAGSETSYSTVITKEDGWLKRAYNDDISRPAFAVLNPELTYTLPEYQTMSGIVDIMMHTFERYFTREEPMALTDGIAEALLKTVMQNAHVLKQEPLNYKARAEIMWAGSLSHNGLTGCGASGDWVSHRLEHELGGMFDVAHGAGLSAVWGSWARYVYKAYPERFAKFAVAVMDVAPQKTASETALLGIEAAEDFFRSIKMPVNIKELGYTLTYAQIKELAEKCYEGNGTIKGFVDIAQEDMLKIFTMAR